MSDVLEVTRYRLSLENAQLSRLLSADDLLKEARKRAPEGRLSIDILGDEKGPGPDLARVTALKRFVAVLKGSHYGDKVRAIPVGGGRYLRGVKVHTAPHIMDTDGNARVDRAHTFAVQTFPGKLESWGICNCRLIAGSSYWSQHAYCNAEDWHASSTIMDQLAKLLARRHGSLDVAHVIHDRRIWDPSQGWHSYSGSDPHTDHVHVDFMPQGSGRPSCA